MAAASGWDASDSHYTCKLTISLLISFTDPQVPWGETMLAFPLVLCLYTAARLVPITDGRTIVTKVSGDFSRHILWSHSCNKT